MKRKILYIVLIMIVSSALVVALFVSSEHIMKRENPFVRRFMPHHIDKAEYLDLEVNSYYIAGLTNDTIYLGNYTAPLLITAVPISLGTKVEHQIKLDETQRSFRSLTVRVQRQEFFVSDGTIPIIYKGSTADWIATKYMQEKVYFSLLQPLDNSSFLFRSQRVANGEHVLGKLDVKDSTTFELYGDALQKQIDGVFDTDGQLVTDAKTDQGVYTYYYRNQYLVYQPQNNQFTRGKTIDTTTLAKIEVTTLAGGEKKMGAPPHKVNSKTYAYNGLLYIKSELLGKNEPKSMWNQASIIDVYDYNKNEYLYSFYAYDHHREKIREFAITDDYFFGLVGNSLVRYEMMERAENREQRTENREQRTGNREQRTENREQGTENREQRTGNKEQGTENREQRTENREQGQEKREQRKEIREQRTENREQRTENREQRTENREQRTENREQGTENREQGTENREQRAENREQRTENRELRTGNREQ